MSINSYYFKYINKLRFLMELVKEKKEEKKTSETLRGISSIMLAGSYDGVYAKVVYESVEFLNALAAHYESLEAKKEESKSE